MVKRAEGEAGKAEPKIPAAKARGKEKAGPKEKLVKVRARGEVKPWIEGILRISLISRSDTGLEAFLPLKLATVAYLGTPVQNVHAVRELS